MFLICNLIECVVNCSIPNSSLYHLSTTFNHFVLLYWSHEDILSHHFQWSKPQGQRENSVFIADKDLMHCSRTLKQSEIYARCHTDCRYPHRQGGPKYRLKGRQYSEDTLIRQKTGLQSDKYPCSQLWGPGIWTSVIFSEIYINNSREITS